jgi:hypothetical protein
VKHQDLRQTQQATILKRWDIKESQKLHHGRTKILNVLGAMVVAASECNLIHKSKSTINGIFVSSGNAGADAL